MRGRSERRWLRQVKGWRRLKEDRQQHSADSNCACFDPVGARTFGRLFARLADTPKAISHPFCCANARAYEGPTVQERRFEGVTSRFSKAVLYAECEDGVS